MTESIAITCRTCRGSGVTSRAHASGDPQLESIGECPVPECKNGVVMVEAHYLDEAIASLHFLLMTAQGVTGVTPGSTRRALSALQAIPGAIP
jgi:hypothetical protein